MLEEVLFYLNNWFLPRENGIWKDHYSVKEGQLDLPFLKDGQYYRIVGSLFNDGLYRYGEETLLTDETFEGEIWALEVPKSVLAITEEITTWIEKNGAAGPYTSESFGGYSYSKATNAKGMAAGWQDVFADRLKSWKKLPGTYPFALPNPRMTPPVPRKDNPWR